jgi:hypothetical protein
VPNRTGNCTWKIVSKLALDAALATTSTTGPVDDAVGSGVHAPAGAVDDVARPGVDAISGAFLASECTGGPSGTQYAEHG